MQRRHSCRAFSFIADKRVVAAINSNRLPTPGRAGRTAASSFHKSVIAEHSGRGTDVNRFRLLNSLNSHQRMGFNLKHVHPLTVAVNWPSGLQQRQLNVCTKMLSNYTRICVATVVCHLPPNPLPLTCSDRTLINRIYSNPIGCGFVSSAHAQRTARKLLSSSSRSGQAPVCSSLYLHIITHTLNVAINFVLIWVANNNKDIYVPVPIFTFIRCTCAFFFVLRGRHTD